MGRGLPALGLTGGSVVTERQAELLFGQGRHPDADRIERELLDDGAAPETARSATVLGRPIEEIEKRKQIPLVALDQTSLIVLRAPGEEKTRRVIERAHERAIATELRWPEDEATETWWASGYKPAKTTPWSSRPSGDRHGLPLLHDRILFLNRCNARTTRGSWCGAPSAPSASTSTSWRPGRSAP
ncbi:relaxase domain-containing protein [Streptomyces sp. NPDC057545]|uniref:relaxase domain-containing protein n=1 Tax=Streptomyces sp. NPDC057545 TaxID=3346164 RepID=UPI0036A8535E